MPLRCLLDQQESAISEMKPLCKACGHTHEFEGVTYTDCPTCTCERFTESLAESVFFHNAVRRAARRREWKAKLRKYGS